MNDRGYSVGVATISRIMYENGWFSIRGGAKALYEMNQKRKENILRECEKKSVNLIPSMVEYK